MMRFAILLSALAACVQSNQVVCGDLTCPGDYTCDLANHRCISPEQIAACKDLPDGTACTVATAPGSCLAGVCDPLVCGDGLVSGAEECDGTNVDGKTCKDFHFYNDAGLACSAVCTFDTKACTGFCGDGVINGGELCDGAPPPLGACYDFGYDAGPLGCSSACGGSFDQCARIGWKIEPLGVAHPNGGAATAHDDGWLVGDQGVILHFNGIVWTAETSPVTVALYSVAALARDDVWAVGMGVVIHRDATQWQTVTGVPVADYTDVCGLGGGHVAIATNDRGVLAWDGSTWTTVGAITTSVQTIRGTSASDLWIIESANYTLWHWDGGSWSNAGPAGKIYGVTEVAPDDVWAIGQAPSNDGLIAHWNGATWTTWTDIAQQYAGVAASGPEDVWVAMTDGSAVHFEGSGWAQVPVAFDGFAVTPVSLGPGEVFAFSSTGFAYRFTGQAFAHYSAGTFGQGVASLWSSSATDILFTQGVDLYRYDGDIFQNPLVESHGSPFNFLGGTGADDVWATAQGGYVYHYTGGTWSQVTPALGSTIDALWVGGGQVWVFTQGAAHQGPPSSTWTDYSLLPSHWIAVAGDSPSDLWGLQNDLITVTGAVLHHWNGSTWQTVTTPRADLTAIGVRAQNDVWLATASQHVLHWDGSSWSDTLVTSLLPWRWIVPYAPDDVFAASPFDVFHFDGSRWSRVRPDLDTTEAGQEITAVTSPGRGHFQYAHEQRSIRDLIRVEPWVCRATETDCNDGIDDDCDGKIDGQDPDCP